MPVVPTPVPGRATDIADIGQVQGYRLGALRIDLRTRRLLRSGHELPLQPLGFQLLVRLCAAGGAVVPRRDLFQALWPNGQEVSDDALTQVVRRTRIALGDDGRALRTVHRIGFRLAGRIEPMTATDAGRGPDPCPQRSPGRPMPVRLPQRPGNRARPTGRSPAHRTALLAAGSGSSCSRCWQRPPSRPGDYGRRHRPRSTPPSRSAATTPAPTMPRRCD
jgi:DNA-binding winged helix-turn-helix (wHTH) protein